MTYAEAMVVGLIQGVTELFPVSSLGHNVLIPALVGGRWAQDLNVSTSESPYLAFIVGLHVATAAAMIIYFWRDWLRIITGFLTSLRDRRIATPDQRLAWMIILATIPVGIAGLLLEHLFRVVFSKPYPTAAFLAVNGLILLGGERLRRNSARRQPTVARPAAAQSAGAAQLAWHQEAAASSPGGYQETPGAYQHSWLGEPVPERPGAAVREESPADPPARPAQHRAERQHQVGRAIAADLRLAAMSYGKAVLIGSSQVFALLPGISRDGIVTVTGMFRGISREDAVRFSFLLSAPVILAAGVYKIPDLTGPLGDGIRGQVLVGSLLAFIGAYLSVRFLTRYFAKQRSLAPFGVYCLAAGIGSIVYLLLR